VCDGKGGTIAYGDRRRTIERLRIGEVTGI
jgi:hypothetical protein